MSVVRHTSHAGRFWFGLGFVVSRTNQSPDWLSVKSNIRLEASPFVWAVAMTRHGSRRFLRCQTFHVGCYSGATVAVIGQFSGVVS